MPFLQTRRLPRLFISKLVALLLILGLLFLSAIAVPRYLVPIPAAGYPGGPGLVCLMDPTSAPAPPANPCPAAPYSFTGPFPSTPQIAPTQIRIGVYINGSSALNGFDITLKSNNTAVLVPAYFDLAGSLLPSPFSIQGCVNGVLVSGNTCGATDGYGTVHVFAVAGLAQITTPPTTGLLFTSIWNIVGNSTSTGTGISFQTGCSGSSVPNVCVTITNASPLPDLETLQTGNTFSNPAPVSVPWIALTSPNATTISVVRGAVVTIVVVATAENGWPFISNDLVIFSSRITSGFAPPFFSSLSCSTGGTSCNTTATLNTATAGYYVLYILGNYTTIDPITGLSDTLVASIRFNVNGQDAALAVSPTGNVYMFGTFPVSVTVQSLGGFAGTVTLSTGVVSPATGILFSYPAPFSLAANAVVTKTVNVTSSAFNRYLYMMRMSAAGQTCGPGCTLVRSSLTIAFSVTGFSLTPNATTIFTTKSSHNLTVQIKSLGNTPSTSFAGPVAISSTSAPPGLTISPNATSVTLTGGGSRTLLVNFTSATPGVYTVRIIGTGGTNGLMTSQTAGLTIGISSIFFNITDTFSGVKANIVGTLSIFRTSSTLSGSTIVNAFNATTGVPIYSKTASVSMIFNVRGTGHFIDEIPTNPYWLSTNCEIDVNAGSASCFLSRTPDVTHTGSVNINDYSIVNLQFGQTLGSPGYNPLADLLAGGRVNILDISIEGLYFGCAVITP